MVDQNETNEVKKTKAQEMIAEIATLVKGSGEEIVRRYITRSAEQEVAQRVDLLDKAFQKRYELIAALGKVNRADEVKKDADGKVIFESWSDSRREEVKKAKEALEKHENSLEKALTTNDFSKLRGG